MGGERESEKGTSWALPLSIARIMSSETDNEVGVRQVQTFYQLRGLALRHTLHW